MAKGPPAPSILVLCPMQVEFQAVRRVVRAERLAGVQVVRTGIGREAIVRVLRRHLDVSVRPQLVVLAGVCGGLVDAPDVPGIARIIDQHGHEYAEGVCFAGPAGLTLIGVDDVIATPREKRELAARTGAAIVDMESHAFAAACREAGVAWSVVWGVNDTPEESLPREVLGWVGPDGRTRALRAVWDMVRRPVLIPHIVRVLRRSNRVLPQVGQRVAEIARTVRPARAGAKGDGSGFVSDISDIPLPRVGDRLAPSIRTLVLFGGSFDPPHAAHVTLPAAARESLELREHTPGSAYLVYVPAARSPLKARGPLASDIDRIAMLRLALDGVPRAVIWTDELDRAAPQGGPSYTVETLRRARAWLDAPGNTGGSAVRLRLLIGADQAVLFHQWREYREVLALAEPMVMPRRTETGAPAGPEALMAQMKATGAWSDAELVAWRGRIIPLMLFDVSATAIREKLGRGAAADDLMPLTVAAYIHEHQLYVGARSPSAG